MENNIPKIIHYVWVGGKPKPESVLKCIESWKKFCPDWEIVEWNEQSFDINSSVWVKESLEKKKFAFASDYLRLYALYTQGGIYMDTDVEIVKPIDKFLVHRAFSGFENKVWIPTAIMGAEKKHPWIKLLLDYYKDRHFCVNNKLDTTTNVQIIGALTKLFYNIELNDTYQELNDGLVFYPHDYFCPKNYVTEIIESTENTHTIHHFAGSWLSKKNNFEDNLVKFIRNLLGNKLFEKVKISYLKKESKKNFKKIKKEYAKQNSNRAKTKLVKQE